MNRSTIALASLAAYTVIKWGLTIPPVNPAVFVRSERKEGLKGYRLQYNFARRPRYVRRVRGGRRGQLLKLSHKYVRAGTARPFMPPLPSWVW